MVMSGHITQYIHNLGMERCQFSDYFKERVWVSDTGLSRPDIYSEEKV